MEMTESHIL